MNSLIESTFRSRLVVHLRRTIVVAAFAATALAQDPPQQPEATPIELPATDQPVEAQPVERRSRRVRRELRSDESGFRAEAGLGYGEFKINARELGGRDREDAAVLRIDLGFDINRHLAITLMSELVGTDDDVFAGRTIESGVGPRAADASVGLSDLDIAFAWNPLRSDDFRLPLRIGPWINGGAIDYERAGVQYDWTTVGLRIGVRPEWVLARGEKADLTVYGGASYAIGYTAFHEDLIGANETYDSEAQLFRAEGGVRVGLGGFVIGLAYVLSDGGVNLSDEENGRRLPELDFNTHMFFLTLGGRF